MTCRFYRPPTALCITLLDISQDKLDAQIAQLEQKLAVERKVRAGAEGMRLVITDKKALAQMELSLSDSQKRLDFLEGELGKVVAKKRQLSMSLGALNQVGGSSVSEGAGPCHKHRATGGVDGSTRRIANIDGADARSNDEDGVGAYFRDESGAVTPPRLCGANVEDVMELSTSASLPPRLSPPTTAMVKVRVDSPTPKPRSSSIGVIPATDDISARADSMATFTSTTARQSSARGPCLCPMDATVHIDGCPKHVAASPAAPPKSVGGFFRAFGRKSSSATSLDGSAVAPPSSSSSTPNQHLSPPSLRGKALADVPRKNSKGSLSNLDLSKSSTELSAEKIAVKIIELRSKIEIESRVKAGAEKLLEALEAKAEPSEKDRENKERVYWKMRVAGEKVGLLKTALVRYQGMHVDGLADIGGM